MRGILFLILLLLPLQTPAALPEFDALYDFERGRMAIGETRFHLERSQDEIYRYTSEAQATGFISMFVDDVIREESLFHYDGSNFWPISYEYRQLNSSKNRDENIAYDWTDRLARVDYRGHESEPALTPGTIDRFLLQLAITVHAQGGKLERTYRVLDNGRVKEYSLRSTGKETISTPAGKFETLLVERVDNNKDKSLRVWLAPELHYLPVRIEQQKHNEETLRLVLKEFKLAAGK